MKTFIKRILGHRIVCALRVLFRGVGEVLPHNSCFEYDYIRFKTYSGVYNPLDIKSLRAKIIMHYHVLEKGLTMPKRKLGFGQKIAYELMQQINNYKSLYNEPDYQVSHAVSVLRAYWKIHMQYANGITGEEKLFWDEVKAFSDKYKELSPAFQLHMHCAEFYACKNSSFQEFAWARHTLRHYSNNHLSDEKLAKALDLARSTPSACNRQYCCVYCISDKHIMEKILTIQGGNRGFGCYADKVLVLTADLKCTINESERNDIYVNGGMYLMNLCYALYYYEVAHCILNWSRSPKEDEEARKLLNISPSETIIALLSCGETPKEFDIAESPRTPMFFMR